MSAGAGLLCRVSWHNVSARHTVVRRLVLVDAWLGGRVCARSGSLKRIKNMFKSNKEAANER